MRSRDLLLSMAVVAAVMAVVLQHAVEWVAAPVRGMLAAGVGILAGLLLMLVGTRP